jgi:hypothetical protein
MTGCSIIVREISLRLKSTDGQNQAGCHQCRAARTSWG